MAIMGCPSGINFEMGIGKYGKPFLTQYPDVHFNISHCCLGCAVAVSDCPVGVDIQEVRPFSWEVARRVCGRQELCMLENSDCRERDFIRMWTMKESYVKRLGIGIGYPLDQVDTMTVAGVEAAEFSGFVVAVSGE